MSHVTYNIDLIRLAFISIPVLVVLAIYIKWSLQIESLIYAVIRMTTQLILVGYALIVLFKQSDPYISSAIILVMLLASSWIALRPISKFRKKHYFKTLLAIFLGGTPVLILVIAGVVQLDPWYMPRYLIPLAGMVFSNAMNSVSLCAERFNSEMQSKKSYTEVRAIAYKTALLPLLNNFFAVGLVSLPGMMTGQILAGVSPLLAVRYQIMVMAMVLGAGGISSALYILFVGKAELEGCKQACFESVDLPKK